MLSRSSLTVLSAGAVVAVLAGCPTYDPAPCFPASSAAPADESEGGFSRRLLGWEIDKMAALTGVPDSDLPPSPQFLHAQRDMRTEFWLDAAKGLLSVARGDTPDGKKVRQFAQYDLALSLYRLRYFEETKRLFHQIAEDPKHARRHEAEAWLDRKNCPG